MSTYFDKISDPFAAFLYDRMSLAGVDFNGVTKDNIAQWFVDWQTSRAVAPIDLDATNPDFEEIFDKLQNEVSQYESWKDLSTSTTGVMILSMMAAGIVYNQVGIVRAAQETMLDTARLPNSIYAIARQLGVRLIRKRPVWVLCTLNNSDLLSAHIIPKYSQWTVGRYRFFNREQIVFSEGQAQQTGVILYQGSVSETEFVSTGGPNQRLEIGLDDFSTSDDDVEVYVNDAQWKKVSDGLWRYPLQNVFSDTTTAKGASEIFFGDGDYGNVPPPNSTISVVHVRTEGLSGALTQIGLAVRCLTNGAITGLTESATQGGGDPRDPEFYRRNAPTLYSNREKAVTKADYRALVLTYEDVVDCVVQGQQDIDPSDPTHYNLAYISVLPETPWSNMQWTTFMRWIEDRSIIGVKLIRKDPTPVVMDVTATVYCTKDSNLTSIKAALEAHLTEALKPAYGSIGKNVYKSDIYEILQAEPTTLNNVTHVVMSKPVNDLIIPTHGYVKLRTININCVYGERAK